MKRRTKRTYKVSAKLQDFVLETKPKHTNKEKVRAQNKIQQQNHSGISPLLCALRGYQHASTDMKSFFITIIKKLGLVSHKRCHV